MPKKTTIQMPALDLTEPDAPKHKKHGHEDRVRRQEDRRADREIGKPGYKRKYPMRGT